MIIIVTYFVCSKTDTYFFLDFKLMIVTPRDVSLFK